MKAVRLKCNGLFSPLCSSKERLWFQWVNELSQKGESQKAYQIQVWTEKVLIWDTGKRYSKECVYIPYEGAELESAGLYRWRVRLWNEKEEEGEWSVKAVFRTGLTEADWKGMWIGYDDLAGQPFDPEKRFYCADDFQKGENEYYLPPVPYLRKVIQIEKTVSRAELFLSAFGIAKCWINGRKAGGDLFSPGYSDYPKTVYYRAYEAEALLKKGKNVIGILLADGWYAGYLGLTNREWYGKLPRVKMQLEVFYEDGSRETFATDSDWKASYGKIREADILQGELWDQREEPTDWLMPDFDDTSWHKVSCGAEYQAEPTPYPGLPVEEHDHLFPKWIQEKEDGAKICCFEHYICGVLKVTVKGEAGSSLKIHFAEDLNQDGSLWMEGNRSARCMDEYILAGKGVECFQPMFTYHGFRYAKIEITGTVELLDVEGIQIGTRLEEPSTFRCSSETMNLVWQMIKATEKANLFEVPTDCTARDERLGWGMEGNHFLYAMTRFHNLYPVIRKWLRDIFDGQHPDGGMEAIAPPMRMKDVEQYIGDLQSNHGIHMVYALYWIYGDTQTARSYWEPLNRYFDFLEQNSDRHLRIATSGDWLGIWEETGHSDFNHGYGECKPSVIGTAHYAIAISMMEKLSRGLGETEAEKKYRERRELIKTAFRRNFIQRDGTLRQGKQAEYLLALAAGFFEKEEEKNAVERLKEKMTKDGTVKWFGGTTSTPYLLKTLKKHGEEELAAAFLNSRTYPSIGYMYEKGFDTIWERWDAVFEDGMRHPQSMNALCHEGFAVVGSYLIEGIAGIECLGAGYKKIGINPGIGKMITCCEASYQSIYGEISCSWNWEGGKMMICCRIPANTTAVISVPCDRGEEPTMEIGTADFVKREKDRVILEVSPGTYRISSKYQTL